MLKINRSIAYFGILIIFGLTMVFFIDRFAHGINTEKQQGAEPLFSQITGMADTTPASVIKTPFQQAGPMAFINNIQITLDVADTPEERARGLSGRESLEEMAGMLFLFEEPGRHSFWMRDMNFPLDFIWINGNTIVDVTENVPAPTDGVLLETYTPKGDADKMIEVNAGWIKRHMGASPIGQTVDFAF